MPNEKVIAAVEIDDDTVTLMQAGDFWEVRIVLGPENVVTEAHKYDEYERAVAQFAVCLLDLT